jgi:hypothetical protein
MACPYFEPVAPRASRSEPQSAMLPLGDSWTGVCCADPAQPWQPDEAVMRPLCNLGYARGQCAHFPSGDGPDAVRFTVSRDDGASLRLYYVIERDHHPFAHGPLEYSLAARRFVALPPGGAVTAQAQAYVSSYLRLRISE